MDQDVLTNGALGALWKQDQARRRNRSISPQGSLLSTPGLLASCLSPKQNENITFPQLQLQSSHKRKTDPQLSPLTPRKRVKYSLKEMAEEFTASTIELAARSVMLPRAPHEKNTKNKLPGISQSINVFMSPNPEKTVPSVSPKLKKKQEEDLFGMDMSWAEPTPIRELPSDSCSSLSNPQGAPLLPLHDDLDLLEPTPLPEPRTQVPLPEEPSLLHRSACLFPTNFELIKGALDLNPQEIRRKAPPLKEDCDACGTTCGYPLNIALEHDASLEVLQLLADAAPEVITCRDGPDDCGSLAMVLVRKRNQNFLQVLHLLIKANPMSLRMTDRQGNTPIHIALGNVETATNLELIRVLCMLYPPALLQTNANGQTPLQVAQRQATTDRSVLAFVQDAHKQELERVSSSSSSK